jgi:hypothetical protein
MRGKFAAEQFHSVLLVSEIMITDILDVDRIALFLIACVQSTHGYR